MQEDGFSSDVTVKDAPIVEHNTVPAKVSKAMYLDHFSVIINKLAILGMLFCLFATIGQVVTFLVVGIGFVFFIFFMLAATILTLGILLLSDDFRRLWGYVGNFSEITDKINAFFNQMLSALPYVSVITMALAVASIVCISLNKQYKHPVRIVMAGISIAVAGITLILMLTGGVSAWTN